MQIVIDIPEEVYKACIPYKDTPIISSLANYDSEMTYAIANGTPLPKGHGDLIDRKELLKQPMDKVNYPSNYVKIAPTIIEADKAESEDK